MTRHGGPALSRILTGLLVSHFFFPLFFLGGDGDSVSDRPREVLELRSVGTERSWEAPDAPGSGCGELSRIVTDGADDTDVRVWVNCGCWSSCAAADPGEVRVKAEVDAEDEVGGGGTRIKEPGKKRRLILIEILIANGNISLTNFPELSSLGIATSVVQRQSKALLNPYPRFCLKSNTSLLREYFWKNTLMWYL